MALMFKGISTVIDLSPLIADGVIDWDILNETDDVELSANDLLKYPTFKQQVIEATHLDKGVYITDGEKFIFPLSVTKYYSDHFYYVFEYTNSFIEYGDDMSIEGYSEYKLMISYSLKNGSITISDLSDEL